MKFRRRSKSETCLGLHTAVSSGHWWQMGTRSKAFSIHCRKQGRLCFPHFGSEAKIAISRDGLGPLAGPVCGALSGLGLQCMLAASPAPWRARDPCSGLPSSKAGCVGWRQARGLPAPGALWSPGMDGLGFPSGWGQSVWPRQRHGQGMRRSQPPHLLLASLQAGSCCRWGCVH